VGQESPIANTRGASHWGGITENNHFGITPAAFDGVAISRGTPVMTLPARSVVALDIT
jgi:hypothetical protein